MRADNVYCTPFPATKVIGITAIFGGWRTSVRIPETATLLEGIEALERKIQLMQRNKMQARADSTMALIA